MAIEIKGFSPRVYAAARRFFNEERPVFRVKALRAGDMASPLVKVGGWRCEACDWQLAASLLFDVYEHALDRELGKLGEEMPRGTLPADMIEAIEITHAYDLASRSVYCGGKMEVM
jgi:hypothetical protein